MRRILSAAAVAILAVGLAACGADPLAEQYRAGDNKGFIAANGFQTQEIAPDQRGEAVDFAGTLDNGSPVSSADFAGQVLVVNFWYATCGPCIIEAPRLEQAFQTFEGQDVEFLGINTYDQPATALAFARDNGVSYPSAMAVGDAELKLAFAEKTPSNATPTTPVLDRQGRVAARVIGELPEASILEAMVRTVLAESA